VRARARLLADGGRGVVHRRLRERGSTALSNKWFARRAERASSSAARGGCAASAKREPRKELFARARARARAASPTPGATTDATSEAHVTTLRSWTR